MPVIRKTTPYKRTVYRKSRAAIPSRRMVPMRSTYYKVPRPAIKYDNVFYMKVQRSLEIGADNVGSAWHYMFSHHMDPNTGSSVTPYSTGPFDLPEFAGLRVNFARYSVEKMIFEVQSGKPDTMMLYAGQVQNVPRDDTQPSLNGVQGMPISKSCKTDGTYSRITMYPSSELRKLNQVVTAETTAPFVDAGQNAGSVIILLCSSQVPQGEIVVAGTLTYFIKFDGTCYRN